MRRPKLRAIITERPTAQAGKSKFPKNPQASTSFKVNGQALSGFAPYQNGMTIYSDTYRVLYRIPKTNSYPSSPYGAQSGNWCDYKNCIEGNIIAEDGTYDYRQTQADVFQQHGQKLSRLLFTTGL